MPKSTNRSIQVLVALTLIVALLAPTWRTSQALAGNAAEPLAAAPGAVPAAPAAELASVPGAGAGWWAAVQEQIEQDMYALSEDAAEGGAASYVAHNTAHAFDLAFSTAGVRLAPAGARAPAADEATWSWSLGLAAYGYEGDLQPLAPEHKMAVTGNQVEYQRSGLVEWYVNDARGLEQGFVLDASPPGAAAGKGLVLEMALDTDLLSALSDDAQRIDFYPAGGAAAVLCYSELHVADATGRELPAHLALVAGGISIWIDDTGANYPLLVDPLIAIPDWAAGGENDGDEFGWSVAAAGDVNGDGYDDVIVGADLVWEQGRSGKVYVYHGSATGLSLAANWSKLGGVEGGNGFGFSVSTAGDVNGDGYDDVIVGAPFNGIYDGTAYIWFGSASGLSDAVDGDWFHDGTSADFFGSAVSTAGDVNGDGYDDVLVGQGTGSAHIYYGAASFPGPGSGSFTSVIRVGSLGTAGDVNGDGYDDVVVGSRDTSKGTAYVYYGSASGLRADRWQADGEADGDSFGRSVGTAGDVNGDGYDDVLVGAPGDPNGSDRPGKLYLYHGSASGLGPAANWTASGAAVDDHFGASVGTAGDVNGDGYADVVVGAFGNDDGGSDAGQVYLYRGAAEGLEAAAAWTATGEGDSNYFGYAVSTAGDVNADGYADVIVGAYGYDGSRGRVYVYHGPALGVQIEYDWRADGETASDQFGWSLATAGDVNGDGYSDVVVGAPYNGENGPDAGKVYVYYGSAGGLGLAPAWMATGEAAYDGFGSAAGTAGDLNGDGFDDLVVGAYSHGGGKVYVYYGSAAGLGAAGWTASGQNAYDELGRAAGTAGDVNGDGYDDLVVGASGYPDGNAYGKVYVYYGAEEGLGTAAAWSASGQADGDRFGWAVGTAGDVNADGYADVVIGAPRHASQAGRVYVWHGGDVGLAPGTANWTASGQNAGDQFGYALGMAGDVHGDGYSDVVVGAPYHDTGGADAGRAYVYRGSATGLTGYYTWAVDGQVAGDRLGAAVGTAGDVNGDGYADVVLGVYGSDSMAGEIQLYHGTWAGLMPFADWASGGDRGGDRFGLAVGTAGDVNGDGYSDILAGAPGYDAPGRANTGRAYVYHGAAAGPTDTASWNQPGTTVATAGDVNGDGYADVVRSHGWDVYAHYGSSAGLSITADWSRSGNRSAMAGTAGDVNGDGYGDIIIVEYYDVYVYYGGPAGLTPGPADWTTTGFFVQAATAGDVNGDGYADIIVSETGSGDIGLVHFYYGSATGLSDGPAGWSATGEAAGDRFGWAVSTAGDVNGDGYADVIIGAYGNDENGVDSGKVYVYYGSSAGLSQDPGWSASGEGADDGFGAAVGRAGDVNGDGYADVVVGAPRNDDNGTNSGKVYVYHGSALGLDTPFSSLVGKAIDWFGYSVGAAGDVNGDGYADVVIGAPFNDDNGGDAGKAYLYYGGSMGLGTGPAPWTTGWAAHGELGRTTGTAGDVNGDGYTDVVVNDMNMAYLYQGNDGGGRLVRARQLRGDGSGLPVQPWGPSYTRDSFGVSLHAINPLGRGRARLQVQACPPAVPFGDAACRECTVDNWTEVMDSNGVELSEMVSGLVEGRLYRWRARTLYDSPLYPHGPWHRFLGQGQEADVRAGLLATDLRITKTMMPIEEVTPPAPITYTLAFTAAGGPAVGVVITDIMPSSLVSITVVASGVTISDTGVRPGYVWWAGDLAAGQSGTITISGVASATRFVNTAIITGTSRDMNPANNVASVQTHVDGILYVDGDARGADDGSSWANAYTDLQSALASAAAGDEIWAAEGVYKPTSGTGRAATFQLREGVAIYGGFAGNEAYRHQRDWLARPTVLSGDIGTVGNNADNTYHVVVVSSTVTTAVLDGFVISGGRATGGGSDGQGGGIYLDGGSPTLRNLALLGNSADQGGALYNEAGSPALVNVTFSGNAATAGGGLYNQSGSLILVNATFSENSATSGGAVYNEATATLTNCIVWDEDPNQNLIAGGGTTTVTYSDVRGGHSGTGNLAADPQFVDADGPDGLAGTLDDDLRLHTTFRYPSPVIDQGAVVALPADTEDLDGDGDVTEPLPFDASARARLIGFTVETPTVDMGAYEANILDVLAEGDALLVDGQAFRLEHLQLLSADTLAQALQNYANFNDGEWYYAFCADYDLIDEHGYCPETGPYCPDGGDCPYPPGVANQPRENVRNKLLDAVDLYRVAVDWPTADWTTHDGTVIHVQEVGGSSVLAATQEIANDHLVFGNEFLVDATDYRFSTAGIPYADEIITQELEELAQAQRQFELVMDLVFRAFGEWGAGEYCTADEFETFGVTSGLMMSAVNETASRYYMLGQSEHARNVYMEAERNQSLHLQALAALADETSADYLTNGSYEMLNNLSQLRDRAEAIRDGLDFFGFAPAYAPLQAYEQLLELAEGPTGNTGLWGTARDLEDQAREAQRTFDANASDMSTELDNLTVELDNQLFDLCGQSDDDYETCEGGLMGQNFEVLDVASIRVGLAWLKAQNLVEQVRIEEERAGQVIQVMLRQGEQVSAAQLAIGKLQAYKETKTESASGEVNIYAGMKTVGELYWQQEGALSTNPFKAGEEFKAGWKVTTSAEAGFQIGGTFVKSAARSWDPNAEVIGQWGSIQALQQAEAQAQIEGTNRDAAVRNLLLQQSEALREYEIAMAEFDKLVAEHNHLAEQRSRLLNKREQAINRVASHNSHLLSPAYRIWRDSLTTQSAAAHTLASQFAYLTARASEYELLTPYPNLDDIFKARTANDIRLFLDGLKVWHQALDHPGQLNRYPYTLSLADDIYLLEGEKSLLDAWDCRIITRTFECEFSTMLDQRNAANQYLFSLNIWNNRVAGLGAPLADNAGIRVNIITDQDVNAGDLEVVLIHGKEEGGAEDYRNVNDEIVQYDPGTAVPVGYLVPPALDPANTTVVVRPDINGQGGLANGGLINLSIASSWILRIPAESRGDLDYRQIKDIEIYLDTTGRALPGWEAEAAQDAARLQAELAMEPPTEERLRQLAAGRWSEPAGSRLAFTWLAQRTTAPSIPGQIGGSYYGNIVITSPITLAVQLLNLEVWNDDGTLSGTVNVSETALYSGSIGLQGLASGEAFSLTSDEYLAVVAGRPVAQSFALAGHIVEGGDILKATYTGTITNLLPFPIVVQGKYSASRPGAPGSKRLLVEAETWSVPVHASLPITATLLDEAMQVMTATQRITFSTHVTGGGTVLPAAVDTVDGIAVVTFTAGGEPGEAVVVATTGEITGWVRIQIEPNAWPVADAGPDQEAGPGETVTLDGSGSSDADGNPLAYGWQQTGGEAVSFAPALSVTTFVAPANIGLLTFTFTVTDTGGLTDTDTMVVTVAKTRIYLPLILKGHPQVEPAPDLVIETVIAGSDGVQAVIKNRGNAPVLPNTPFWIDVYIAPDPIPTGVNQPWDALCEEGLVWGIPAEALPLGTGEVMTLTYSTDPGALNLYYWADLSNWTGSLPVGTPVYAQVDSWGDGTAYGAVLEGHEILGHPYNNIVGPVVSTDGGIAQEEEQPATPLPESGLPAPLDGLPPRP